MQMHAYPFHDANRTQISKTEMPVLNSRGVKVGCASSAAGARTLLNAAASMQKVGRLCSPKLVAATPRTGVEDID